MNLMSIASEPAIIPLMETSLGSYLRRRRTQLGMTQEALGERSGLTKGYLSQVESGRIGFPGADIRRRLAKALGVTHLELLIAAGELLEEEVATAGVVGVVEADPNDPRQRLHRLIDDINWSAESLDFVEGALDRLANPPQRTMLVNPIRGTAHDSR
jgi:transcriptional regulator with XRE-family HTH domain